MQETYLVITKGNVSIPFKFSTSQMQVMENEQQVVKIIENWLGAFMKAVEGYLVGIGADNHLRKLPENLDELEAERKPIPNQAWIVNPNYSQNPNTNYNFQTSYQNPPSPPQPGNWVPQQQAYT